MAIEKPRIANDIASTGEIANNIKNNNNSIYSIPTTKITKSQYPLSTQ